jgi:hypothetical protein
MTVEVQFTEGSFPCMTVEVQSTEGSFPCIAVEVQSTEGSFPCMTVEVQSTEGSFPCNTGVVQSSEGIFPCRFLPERPELDPDLKKFSDQFFSEILLPKICSGSGHSRKSDLVKNRQDQ